MLLCGVFCGTHAGRQIELRIEDNQSTNPETVLAYSKLIGESDITARHIDFED